jgi:acetoin utilization protein AcuC
MSESALLVWSEELLTYDLGATHPMAPGRLAFTMALAHDLGVLAGDHTRIAAPRPAPDDLLQLVHEPAYVAAVRDAARRPSLQVHDSFGLGSEDNPVFDGIHDASALVTGATVDAAMAVRSGAAQHAVNLAGGLHHAMPARASGFCIYNDAAVAIAALLADGVQKVAYVDLDAHHGDGVEAAFYGDPRVLTISLHESGYTAFPGTGFPGESGHGAAEGTAVNVALPPGTGDAGWLRAFHAVVPPLVRAFEPQILITQLGCDTHRLDPLAQLELTVDAHRHSYAALHRLAHEVTDGRWIAVGGGGYEIVQVVPRSWTHLLAEITGSPLDPDTATPDGWLQFVHGCTGREGPKLLTDGTEPTYYAWDAGEGDPDDPVDRAIAATRRAVFPDHGLDHIDPR